MSLGATYRINVYNNTGVASVTNKVLVNAKRWKFNTSGVQSWEATPGSVVALTDIGSISTGGYAAGPAVDNTANAYLGGTFEAQIDFTGGSVPNGPVVYYLQRSTDGGTTWPDNGQGQVIAVLNCTAAQKYTTAVEV